ncbi:hypothetical protein ACJ6TS_20980 [Citrobacter telavivensis]
MFKNNPLGLGSITELGDIIDLIRLYVRKADHQKAYNTLNGRRVTDSQGQAIKRFSPWVELELCHIYPNSKGGANIARNIIIAPSVINRMMKDAVPVSTSGGTFSGIKGSGSSLPVKTTLLKALTEEYGPLEVQKALYPVKHMTFADPNVSRRLFGTNIYAYPPLLKLLKEEALRLNLWQLLDSVNHIKNCCWLSAGPANELFAVAAFHAILNGDADNFIDIFSKLREDLIAHAIDKKELDHAYYQNVMDQYMSRYFHLDLHNWEACNIFYNTFFTVSPLDKNGSLIIPE